LVKVKGQSACEHISTEVIKTTEIKCDGTKWTANIKGSNVEIEQIVCKTVNTPPPPDCTDTCPTPPSVPKQESLSFMCGDLTYTIQSGSQISSTRSGCSLSVTCPDDLDYFYIKKDDDSCQEIKIQSQRTFEISCENNNKWKYEDNIVEQVTCVKKITECDKDSTVCENKSPPCIQPFEPKESICMNDQLFELGDYDIIYNTPGDSLCKRGVKCVKPNSFMIINFANTYDDYKNQQIGRCSRSAETSPSTQYIQFKCWDNKWIEPNTHKAVNQILCLTFKDPSNVCPTKNAKVAIGQCLNSYIKCNNWVPSVENCPIDQNDPSKTQVFYAATSTCKTKTNAGCLN
ncbi:hypothetical protein WR25_10644, partial [Diploscapter pachys]